MMKPRARPIALALKSVSVVPTDPALSVAGSVQFSAIAAYSNGTTDDITAQATWQSSNPAVATVNATGLAVAVADGSSLISATFSGLTGSSGLTVNVTLMSLAISPASATLVVGATQQFTVTGTYSDSSTADLTNAVIWKVADTTVATVNESGLATAIGAGDAGILAHTASVIKGAALTVTAPVALSPCEALARAKQQLVALMSGQAVAEVENPQLGRVVYAKADIPQLQRMIDGLAADCAASLGITTATGAGRRKPISIEAWP